jgi:hypothetical protein
MSFEISHAKVERFEPASPPDHRLEDAFLHVDHELVEEIAAYTKFLPGNALNDFRTLGFSDKIDKMCWVYGANEYTRDKSIHIKTLKILKGIGDFMFHGDHDEPRRYDLPFDPDGYWLAVDTKLQDKLHKLVLDNGGTESLSPDQALTTVSLPPTTEYSWQALGFSIVKEVLYSETTPIHAVYEITKLPESV